MKTEPAIIIGAIEAVILGLLGVIAYSFSWDPELLVLWTAVAAPGVVILGAILTRMNVFSPATHEAEVERALREPPPDAP